MTSVSSSLRRKKLRFDDDQDLVLAEEMRRKLKDVFMETTIVMENRGKVEALTMDLKIVGSSNVFIVVWRDTRRGTA